MFLTPGGMMIGTETAIEGGEMTPGIEGRTVRDAVPRSAERGVVLRKGGEALHRRKGGVGRPLPHLRPPPGLHLHHLILLVVQDLLHRDPSVLHPGPSGAHPGISQKKVRKEKQVRTEKC